jgi:hypothetical protein
MAAVTPNAHNRCRIKLGIEGMVNRLSKRDQVAFLA